MYQNSVHVHVLGTSIVTIHRSVLYILDEHDNIDVQIVPTATYIIQVV